MIERSKEFGKIALAILKAQPNIDTAVKKASGHHGVYADLTEVILAVKKPLNEQGVLILQAVDIAIRADGSESPILITTLIHPETEQYFSSNTPILCQTPNDPQKLGSGVTYAKRYGLQAMGLLPSEDDDGRRAARKAKDAPAPNEAEIGAIEAAYNRLLDSVPEGYKLNRNLIAELCMTRNKEYPKTVTEGEQKADGILKGKLLLLVCEKE